MSQKKILVFGTSLAVLLIVASRSNADVTIIHNADGGTDLQAGNVKISTGAHSGAQVETGRSQLSTDDSFLVSRRYKYRRYSKPAISTVKIPNTKIPSVPIVRSPGLKIPDVPTVGVPTVIQRNETYSNGSIYSTRTSTRSSNGSSSNSQSTIIRGNGQSHTNSNHDSDD
jgi:hypothetical protein